MTDLLQCLFSQNCASVGSVRQEGMILYFLEDHGSKEKKRKMRISPDILVHFSVFESLSLNKLQEIKIYNKSKNITDIASYNCTYLVSVSQWNLNRVHSRHFVCLVLLLLLDVYEKPAIIFEQAG